VLKWCSQTSFRGFDSYYNRLHGYANFSWRCNSSILLVSILSSEVVSGLLGLHGVHAYCVDLERIVKVEPEVTSCWWPGFCSRGFLSRIHLSYIWGQALSAAQRMLNSLSNISPRIS
jgi:hypothetical protein